MQKENAKHYSRRDHHKYKKHREVVFLFMIFAGDEPRVRTEGFGTCVANDNLP